MRRQYAMIGIKNELIFQTAKIIIIYCNLHCTYPHLVLYITCLHFMHHLSGGITINSRQKWLFFPLCVYKVTLCIVDHSSLKRTLDWTETSEFTADISPFDSQLV